MRKLSFLLLVCFGAFLVACGAEPGTVEVTRIVTEVEEIEVTREVEVTRIVETEVEKIITRPVEVTRIVVATATPEPTPKATPVPSEVDTSYLWAVNYLGIGESAGVTIELGRVLFTYKDNPMFDSDWTWGDDFNNVDMVGEFIIKVTNNSNNAVIVNGSYEGVIQLNDEQINLGNLDYRYDDLDEDIFPGATIIEVIWFPIRRTNIEDISTVSYHSGEVRDAATYREIGSRVSVSADIPEHIWEPLPEDLGG